MKKLIVLILIALSFAMVAQRTTRRGLHAKAEAAPAQVRPLYDTIVAPGADRIETRGYDKPLRSRRETFFATNTGNVPVHRIAFTISYFDTDRRMLHRASHNVAVDIPAGESRLVGVRSWDVQQTFYYVHSAVAHKSPSATPFDVAIAVDTLFVGN